MTDKCQRRASRLGDLILTAISVVIATTLHGGLAYPAKAAIIFSDNFNDIANNAPGSQTGFKDLLNGTSTARTGQTMPLGTGTYKWSAGNSLEANITSIGDATFPGSVLQLTHGGISKLTANFTATSLSNSSPLRLSMLYQDTDPNRANFNGTGRRIEGFDANDNVLFSFRTNKGTTDNALQYRNSGATSYTTFFDGIVWGTANTSNLRQLEVVLRASTYDIWLDVNDDGVQDVGEFVNGLSYVAAPTGGFDELVIVNDWNQDNRGRHNLDNVLVSQLLPAITGDPLTGSILDLGTVLADGPILTGGALEVENSGDPGTTLELSGFSSFGDFGLDSGDAFDSLLFAEVENFLFSFDPTGKSPGLYTQMITLDSNGGQLTYTLQATVTANVVPEPAAVQIWAALALSLVGFRCYGARRRKRR